MHQQQHPAHSCLLSCVLCRCINGSTALHTAAYFGIVPVMKDLLNLGVDINLLDYKGATALHRAKDVETMQVSVSGATAPRQGRRNNAGQCERCHSLAPRQGR